MKSTKTMIKLMINGTEEQRKLSRNALKSVIKNIGKSFFAAIAITLLLKYMTKILVHFTNETFVVLLAFGLVALFILSAFIVNFVNFIFTEAFSIHKEQTK